MTAKIYTSKFFNANKNLLASPVLDGGEAVNMLQGLTYKYWKPEVAGVSQFAICSFNLGQPILVNYFAFDNHNLLNIYQLTGIRLIGADDNVFTNPVTLGTILSDDIIPGANVLEFTNTNLYRYYAIQVYSDISLLVLDPIIGIFFCGEATALPEGMKPSYTPPKYGNKSDITNNKSGTNNFIGRSVIRKGYEFIIKNENVDPSWMVNNWNELYNYIEQSPFFYLWNDIYSADCVYGWTVGKIGKPKYTDPCNMSFSLKCEGFKQ